jgi:PAS domain S-box-containing protein
MIVEDYLGERRLEHVVDHIVAAEGVVAGIAAPIQMGESFLGVLYAFNRRPTAFAPEDLDTLTLIANLAALEITRSRMQAHLQRTGEELERRVAERTRALSDANAQLRRAIEEHHRTGEALRRSEERFREMAAHIQEVFWLFDWENRRVIYASPAYEAIWGRPVADLLEGAAGWEASIHPDDREAAAASFQRIVATGQGESWAYRILRPDGTLRWIQDRGVAIRDADGRIRRIAGIAEDVTAREAAEMELARRRKFLESVLHQAPDAIVTLDARNRVRDWNPGAERLFGYTREEAEGRSLDDLVARDAEAREAAAITARVLSGETLQPLETQRYRKDGTPVSVIASGAPILVGGELQGVLALYTDITALKRTEAALRESEERFRAVYEGIPDPVAVSRLEDSLCVDVNEAFVRVSGYARHEAVGRPATELGIWTKDEDRERLLNEFHLFREVKNLEAEFRCKDGRVLTGLISARPLTLNGQPHLLSITRDITQLKTAQAEKQRLETQLVQAQKLEAIGTLAGGIAHDFNNLLMGIQGRCSLMQSEIGPHDAFQEHLQGIEAYVRSATDLTRQLLGFARGGKYEVQAVDLNRLLENSASMFGRTRKEIRLHTRLEPALWTVEVDRGQMEQVLLNLMVNAWQAMPGGGDLYLSTDNTHLDEAAADPLGLAAGRYVTVTVTDTGVGMDEATRRRIFDPFFTTKEMGRGTGLGLASAFGIVKSHGGGIGAVSQKGQGSTFTIHLPAVDKPVVNLSEAARALARGSETVLLVDDEPMILEVGRRMLEKMGYRVLTAAGGREALALFGQDPRAVHLVVLDMIMPGMGGSETFDQLKAVDPRVRVLLSSGYSVDGQAGAILRRGCCGFLQKPFNLMEFSRKLREVLDAPPPAETPPGL